MATKTVNGITTEFDTPAAPSPGIEYKIVHSSDNEWTWGANDEAEYLAAKEIADQKATDKASAVSKLKVLGLTSAEINSLTNQH
jgi:hypothetical protein